MKSAPREVYSDEAALLPEVPTVGWDHFQRASRVLHAHTHERYWEFCYIVHGQVDWWMEGRIYPVHRGDIYITRPGERHGGVDAMMHPCELYWVHFLMPASGCLPALDRQQSAAIVADLDRLEHRTFPGSPRLHESFRRFHQLHRSPRDPYAAMLARAALHELLAQLFADHGSFAERFDGSDRQNARIGRAIRWMESRLTENFAVDEVAEAAGLSISRFHELFLAETGQTPNEFRTRQRIARARQWLRGDRPITHIALDLGFSTSQYFATVFKASTGMTPGEYRRRAGSPPGELIPR